MSKSTSTIDAHVAEYEAAARQEYGLEVITESEAHAADLRAHAEAINEHIDLVTKHEEAFEESTLEPRLLIGQQVLAAQEIFGLTKAEAGRIGGSKSQRDMLTDPAPNPLGFTGWLAREIPRLKRPTAIKYATAYKALGLPGNATLPKIRDAVKTLRHKAGKNGDPMPTLGSLYKAAKPAKSDLPKLTHTASPTPLEDAREFFTVWREEGERLISEGHLDHLDKPGLESLKEFQGWLRDRLNARLKSL